MLRVVTGNSKSRELTNYDFGFGPRVVGTGTRQQVAATCRGNTLQRQIASCLLENFCENLCRCNRICRRNKSHRFSLIWIFATCCSDKILSRRQRFSQKFSSTHEAICRQLRDIKICQYQPAWGHQGVYHRRFDWDERRQWPRQYKCRSQQIHSIFVTQNC